MPLNRYLPGSRPASTSSNSSRTTTPRSSSARRRDSPELEVDAPGGTPIVVEEFGPPKWRPVMSSKADLGYPDFYPCRPGFQQLEDELNEENVQRGFQPKNSIAVSSEGFSMHGMIHGQLKENALGKLDALARELLAKRDESMPTLGPRTYRLPPRVTYNDAKRLAFIADLANPNVPLNKLARVSVPHGYKGVDLLETMWSPAPPAASSQNTPSSSSAPPPPTGPIQVERAAWFIRILGANEVVMLRNRPSNATALSSSWTGKPLTPSQLYTNEFTGIFTTFLRKQLMDLVLPQSNSKVKQAAQSSAVAVGKQAANVNKNAGVLGDAVARARWIEKWDYSLDLLRTLHARYLISSRTLATWLADFAATCNLAQIGFIAQLTEEYVAEVIKHVPLARSLLRALLDKLAEIRRTPASDTLPNVVASMTNVVRVFFSANPDIVLSPTTWLRHAVTIQDIVLSSVSGHPISGQWPLKRAVDQESPASTSTVAISGILADSESTAASHHRRKLLYHLNDVQRRNERLLSRSTVASSKSMSPRRQAMADIQKLDSLSAITDINDFMLHYFDGAASPTAGSFDYTRLEEKINILLVWSLNVFTLGDHRPYAVGTLLKKWEEVHVSHRPADTEVHVDLFKPLYNWLDSSEAAQKSENIPAIALTFGELTREGIFSYGRYLQLLIARGYTSRAATRGGPRSHHLNLLEAMPIFVQDKGMLLQRRIILYGLNSPQDLAKLKLEAETQERLREEIARHVPELFGRSEQSPPDVDWNSSELARSCSRYELVQARFWIFPLSVAFIDRLTPSSFARVLNFFESCRGYATVLDFILRALKAPVHDAVLNITLDTIRRGAEVWTSMDRQRQIASALLDKFTALQNTGHFNSVLWKQLRHFSHHGYLAASAVPGRRASQQFASDSGDATERAYKLPTIREICSLASAEDLESAVQGFLANAGRLTRDQWLEVLEVFRSTSSASPRMFSAFLARLESTSGVDTAGIITDWLEQHTPKSRMLLLYSGPSNPVLQLLVHLVAAGCLQTSTVLNCVIFPQWTALAEESQTGANEIINLDSVVTSTISLATQLLLIPRSSSADHPRFDIMDVKALETSRADAFRDPDALRLVKHLPLLVVLEAHPQLSERSRDDVQALRLNLSLISSFRTAAFRHLELLKDVFLAPIWAQHQLQSLDARMIDALKAIMTDGGPSKPRSEETLPPWSRNTAHYSAWRWTRTVLELRLSFKQLAGKIVRGEDVETSRKALGELARSMFGNDVNNDETDLICEAFRGVEAVAVEQVVNSGVDHLTSLVDSLASVPPADCEQTLDSIQNVIRMLQSIVDAHTQAADVPPDSVAAPSSDKLTLSLATLLRQISSSLKSGSKASDNSDQSHTFRSMRPAMSQLRAFVAVVKFHLASAATSGTSVSPRARQGLAEAAAGILDILWHLPPRGPDTGVMADLLADIHSYLVDELPREGRPALQSAISKLQTLNGDPGKATARDILKYLLPFSTPPRRPMTLIDPAAGDNSSLYDDRPWEASEQMETNSRSLEHEDSFLDPTPLANNASIPLSACDTRVCRDKVPLGSVEEEQWLAYSSERNLGNGLAGEVPEASRLATTIFNGDYQAVQTTLSSDAYMATSPSVASINAREHTEPNGLGTFDGVKSSGHSTVDPIEIDDDDDEIVVVSPPAKRPRTTAARSSVSTKSVSKKAPARAKAAPARKGRRKSQAD